MAKAFEATYTGRRGESSAVFTFQPRLNEWSGPDVSLVRRRGWLLMQDGNAIPCEAQNGRTICGDWSFEGLNANTPTKPQRIRVGDELASLFPYLHGLEIWDGMGLVPQLNQWGPAICQVRADQIIDALMLDPARFVETFAGAVVGEEIEIDPATTTGEWETVTDTARQCLAHVCRVVEPKKRRTPRIKSGRWTAPTRGVGTFMADRIAGFLAIMDTAGCGCKAFAGRMDSWGVDGCETHRADIIDHLVANSAILAAGIAAAKVPGCGLLAKLVGTKAAEPLLRLGAGWLLSKAMEDAKRAIEDRKSYNPTRSPGVKLPPPDPFPFTAPPRFVLISHLWPRRGVWQYHSERLAKIADRFERKILGVATDDSTDSMDDVRAAFPGWEIFEVENNPKLREVATYRVLMPMAAAGSDENTIIVYHHAKGVQAHNVGADAINWWVDAMYRTVIENPTGIVSAMEAGASVVGSFRRSGRMLGTRHQWHFSGTYYAVRAARIHPVTSFPIRGVWWGTESWPGDYFPVEHSHCVFGDDARDLYKPEQQPRDELEKWSLARCS